MLFELLYRWEDAGMIDPVLLPGEQTVLRNLSATLERALVAPFDRNYDQQLSDARARLREQGGA